MSVLWYYGPGMMVFYYVDHKTLCAFPFIHFLFVSTYLENHIRKIIIKQYYIQIYFSNFKLHFPVHCVSLYSVLVLYECNIVFLTIKKAGIL